MRILIDISNIIPGKGGAGGGVAVYADNLLAELDQLIEGSKDSIICFKNHNNNSKIYKNIKVIETSYKTDQLIGRLKWLNIHLPFYCVKHKITVLHRAVPELPFIKVCKYICTLHDLMYRFHLKSSREKTPLTAKLKSIGYGIILRRSVLIADCIVTPSYFIKHEATEAFRLNDDKIEVTHLGVLKIDTVKARLKADRDKFKFIVVAGFYPHKGHAKVIELAKALLATGFTGFSITLRGNAFNQDIVDRIKQEIKEYKLEECIYFNDFKKTHDVNNIYASFDSLLLLSEYEGFGLPVLEAQMVGIPVICSDIPIFKEVLQNSAVFINTADINNSCTKIVNFIKDDFLRKTLIKEGFKNCERFSWKTMAEKTLAVYRQLSYSS